MLQVSFVLAAILAAEAVVLAHPTSYARRNEPLSMVPRSGNQDVNSAPPFSMENLYEEIVNSLMKDQDPRHGFAGATVTPVHRNQDWFGVRGYDADEVEGRGLSDLEGLETRGLAGGGEEKMERRELDDGLMDLMVRESGAGELDARDTDEGPALVPRGGSKKKPKKKKKKNKSKKNKKNTGGQGGGSNDKSDTSNETEIKAGAKDTATNPEPPATTQAHGDEPPATNEPPGDEPPAYGNDDESEDKKSTTATPDPPSGLDHVVGLLHPMLREAYYNPNNRKLVKTVWDHVAGNSPG